MRLLLIILFSLIGLSAYSQTYSRDGLGIKWIQLEGCRKVSNGQPADSCFVMTNGVNGKLSRCLHISELRALITGGVGPTDSTYLVDNLDGSYSLFNENGTEYPFGYKFEEAGDTIFLTDLDGHRADTLVMSLLDNQTLSWDPGTGDLGIANGNTVNLDGRYLLSEVDGDPTNELQFVDSFYTSNDSLFISLDRDSVAPSYVVLNPGADGNGIYGGSGEVPNNTYAHVPLTNDFAIGHFRSFPASVETSDRGLWLSGDEFYLYANDSTSGGLARIYSSNLDIYTKSTLDSLDSYMLVSPDMATIFSEDGINASNITARPDSLDMYSRLWTPEFDSARLRLETTYGNAGDVLTSDGMYIRWSAPSGGGNGIYGGSGTVDSNAYARIYQDMSGDPEMFTIGYVQGYPADPSTNGLYNDKVLQFDQNRIILINSDSTNQLESHVELENGDVILQSFDGTGSTSNFGVLNDMISATHDTENGFILESDSSRYWSNNILMLDADTLRIRANGTYGNNGQVLTVDGNGDATWQNATGGAQANAIDLSGNVITSNVDGQIDTTLAIGNNTLSYATGTKILTSSVNGVSDTTTLTGLGDILNGGNTTGAAVRIGTNDGFGLSLIVNGSDAMTISAASGDRGAFSQWINSTSTATIVDAQDLRLESTGAPAAGLGIGTEYLLESSTTTNRSAGRFSNYWTNVTDANREGAFGWQLGNNGGALSEVMKLDVTDSNGEGRLLIGSTLPVIIDALGIVSQKQGNNFKISTSQGNYDNLNFYADTVNANADGEVTFNFNSFRSEAFSITNQYRQSAESNLAGFRGYCNLTTGLNTSAFISLRNLEAVDNVSNEIKFHDNSGGPSSIIRAKYTNRTSNYGDLSFATRSASGLNEKIYILSTGQIGFGNSAPTAPTAWVNIAAGTATASTAPLKFTSGTNLTAAEAGAVEYDGTNFYMTNSTPTRCYVMKSLVGSAALDFGNTAAQNSADLTITVTGAADGEEVILGVPNAAVNANSNYTAWVSAANTVTVRFNNYSAIAIDPASATFKVSVIKR